MPDGMRGGGDRGHGTDAKEISSMKTLREIERCVEFSADDATQDKDLLRLVKDAGVKGIRERPLFNRFAAVDRMRQLERLYAATLRGWEAGCFLVTGVAKGLPTVALAPEPHGEKCVCGRRRA